MTARGASLRVRGAALHYTVRGAGPPLLVIQGGARDADRAAALAHPLASAYQVVAYDRRGLRRSRIDDPSEAVSIETHSDDAHRLLAAVTEHPAFVFGSSLGALIGLDLVATHPEQIRLLVAHEPLSADLLAGRERHDLTAAQRELEETFGREGILGAMAKLASLTGDAGMPDPATRKLSDLRFFLGNDIAAARRYRLELPGLRSAAARVVAGAGTASEETLPRRCAEGLAERLGCPLVEFPGGHSGYVSVPDAFAATLRDALDTHDPQPRPTPPG